MNMEARVLEKKYGSKFPYLGSFIEVEVLIGQVQLAQSLLWAQGNNKVN